MTDAGPGPSAMFAVAAEAYDKLMGRYLPTLGPALADAAGVSGGQTALDVGCGPGGLTAELVARLGAASVAAVDPSESFVAACRARLPGADVRLGVAEHLPWRDGTFDVTLACLVVAFMSDPEAGAAEMRRVTRPGGTVATCFWDTRHMPTIATFWRAASEVDPGAPGEGGRFGTAQGDLVGLLTRAGVHDVAEEVLTATAQCADFDDWFSPFPLGVGPVGSYFCSRSAAEQQAIRDRCFELLGRPDGPFTLQARAWCAHGVA